MSTKALVFGIVALAQLAVPAWMIIGHEQVLREGEVFKFHTAPVDPRDPFRGEYVVLSYAEEQREIPGTEGPHTEGETVYAVLHTVNDSATVIDEVMRTAPMDGRPYVRCTVAWQPDPEATTVRVDLPFDRFYLEEGDGWRTEELLRPGWENGERVDTLPAYALVRVKEGNAVIEDLVVGGRSIHEWLKEEPRSTTEPALVPSGS